MVVESLSDKILLALKDDINFYKYFESNDLQTIREIIEREPVELDSDLTRVEIFSNEWLERIKGNTIDNLDTDSDDPTDSNFETLTDEIGGLDVKGTVKEILTKFDHLERLKSKLEHVTETNILNCDIKDLDQRLDKIKTEQQNWRKAVVDLKNIERYLNQLRDFSILPDVEMKQIIADLQMVSKDPKIDYCLGEFTIKE